MQDIEERMQKANEIQPEVGKAKESEKRGEDVLEHEEAILVICKDVKQEKVD